MIITPKKKKGNWLAGTIEQSNYNIYCKEWKFLIFTWQTGCPGRSGYSPPLTLPPPVTCWKTQQTPPYHKLPHTKKKTKDPIAKNPQLNQIKPNFGVIGDSYRAITRMIESTSFTKSTQSCAKIIPTIRFPWPLRVQRRVALLQLQLPHRFCKTM